MVRSTLPGMRRLNYRRHMHRTTPLAALMLAPLLGGCIIYGSPADATLGAMSHLTYAAADQDFQTVVVGNPYPQNAPEVNGMVNAAFQKNYHYLRTNFKTAPANTALNPYKMVVVFDPPRQAHYDDICAAPAQFSGEPTKESMRVVALFCESTVITEMEAKISPRPGVNSPELREAVNFLAWQLVPQDEPDDGNECIPPNC